jgi:hypothetical protein
MTDAITTWLATLPPRMAGEVIVPATIDFPILQAISAADLVPVLVDIRPGLYVAEAERVVPALCERTVGVILPWTYGNAPDLEYIRPACALYEVAVWSEPPPVWAQKALYDALYDRLSCRPDAHGLLPSTLCQEPPRWTRMPLMAVDEAARRRILDCLQEVHFDAHPMRGAPTDDEYAQLGTHMVCGQLTGAKDIGARGFTVPLVDGIADVLAEVLG